MRPHISDLIIYPIKSLKGIHLSTVDVTNRGLANDRRWMLVDENGTFISQRKHPSLALLKQEIKGNEIHISHSQTGEELLAFSMEEPNTTPFEVTVWDDSCLAKPVAETADKFFSDYLKMPVRLCYMHEDSNRQADQRYAVSEADQVSFADGYPILIISEESLALLNSKVDEPLSMDRFRPNIVLKGLAPHEEDTLKEIVINGLTLHGVKPCARCVLTTVNPETAEKGKEPLKTLATYRKTGSKILFGENFIPASAGQLKVGYAVEVKERKEAAIA